MRTPTSYLISILLTLTVAAGPPASATNGDIAYAFALSPGISDSISFAVDVAGQSNGSVLVVGFADRASADTLLVMRVLPNGFRDLTFAGDGLLDLTLGMPDEFTENARIAVLPDDRFLILAGSRDGLANNTPSLVLYSANGTGLIGLNGVSLDSFRSLALIADPLQPGVAYVGGTNIDQFEIRKVLISGNSLSYVAAYGTAGIASADFDLSGGSDDELADLAVATDGKLVAAGTAQFNVNGDYDFAVARFTTAGLLDTSFSGDGKTTFNVDLAGGPLADFASSVVVLPDNRIAIAGTARSGPLFSDSIGVVAQLTVSGAKDTVGFGGGGSGRVLATTAKDFVGLVRQSNGMLVALGNADIDPQDMGEFIFEGFTAAGAIDTTFATNGQQSFGFFDCGTGGGGGGGNDGARALALINGDVAAVGYSNEHPDSCFGDIPSGVVLQGNLIFRNDFE